MSLSGRESIPDVQEWSGGPPGSPGAVGSLSQMSGNGREALPVFRERSGIVGRPSWMSGSGGEDLPDVREALLYTL